MGLNVRKGTFGRPYAVGPQQNREFRVVYPNATLPNMHEQEIVLIDLTEPEPDSSSIDIQEMSSPDVGFCVSPSVHIVNPRGITMLQVECLVERMFNASGVLVVFLQPPSSTAPCRSPLRMQTMPGKSLATSLKRERRALNDVHFSSALPMNSFRGSMR
jgi:hypothetical protein